ncbi:hypothetical protein [Poriferisphaera sp. WC338]|uniref:hypothetical protein n=1 Tax=Poriferisphaera sp. WC338 TaxID=3425129 RepID=UPI003D816ED6
MNDSNKNIEAKLNQLSEQITHLQYPGNLVDDIYFKDHDHPQKSLRFKLLITGSALAAAAAIALMLFGALLFTQSTTTPSKHRMTIRFKQAPISLTSTSNDHAQIQRHKLPSMSNITKVRFNTKKLKNIPFGLSRTSIQRRSHENKNQQI